LGLKASHSASLADLADSHKVALRQVSGKYEAALAEQKSSSAAVLEEARRSHSDEIVRLQHDLENHEAQTASLKLELQEMKASLESVTTERDAHAKENSELSNQHQAQSSQQAEIDRLRRSLEVTQISETALSNELQEALDALGTLEKALIESQDERERLMGDMHDLQKRNKRSSSLLAELNASVKDKEGLQAEVKRLELLVSDLSRRKDTSSILGLGINGQLSSEGMVRAASSTSDLELYTDAPTSIGQQTSTPSLPYPPARHSSVAHLIHGSQPPPTPPPNHPPPPLPTEVLQRNGSIGIPASGSGSSQARASISSAYTKDSHAETLATSRRTDSVSGDTISVDPRVHRKLEEQEAQLLKLTKQLTHCETELQANIDLVSTLENAVQDYERSMRKTRLQMNDLSKERDSYQRQNDQLRAQMNEAQREVDNARHSLQVHEQEQKIKSDNQARIQAEAQRSAEARMAEMQRMNRKSKFNVGACSRSSTYLQLMYSFAVFLVCMCRLKCTRFLLAVC
jgi:kinesin family protein 4/21/27